MFKEKFGVTFIDYLTDVRLEHAKRELIHTNKSLKEICYSVGYNDPNYFSRVFKKENRSITDDISKSNNLNKIGHNLLNHEYLYKGSIVLL